MVLRGEQCSQFSGPFRGICYWFGSTAHPIARRVASDGEMDALQSSACQWRMTCNSNGCKHKQAVRIFHSRVPKAVLATPTLVVSELTVCLLYTSPSPRDRG
eukprot:524586-Amphidinium_carterae.1